ncbi:MAG TPA: peptidase C39 family protein [Candidatus Acidoferrum sp.]|nr:peptidase C39 family protein [Candidatus Acidoferrum sp.]
MAKTRKTSKRPARKAKGVRLSEAKIFEIPNYAQTEQFTSSAACALMVLKYINKKTQLKKENEFEIWQQAVNGSVWHGSRYGLAYALAKRGAKAQITSNVKDEGYEKKLAVYEGINLDTLSASFTEIRDKARGLKIKENYGVASVNSIKKALNGRKIPIVLVNANTINPYLESSPHWVVVKGYDKDTFYINDPYSDSTVTMEPDAFKAALGYENEFHMITVDAKRK